MNSFRIIITFGALIICACAFGQDKESDTALSPREKNTIEEVIKNDPKNIDNKKVAYLSEVTKYGFKNLFNNYTYNPLIPYDQQVNPYAESYMQDYLNAHTKYLQHLQKTATPYFNLIDGILSMYGLPHELKYLAVIESDLKSNALSSAGARGPWQFMDYTARGYGLTVNSNIDERTDYTKSTHAAAKYLLTLYKDLKDWLLVIAAYNGGPGRVYNAIKKSGSRDFWKLQYYLPEESRNHVKKFIATHFIMEDGNQNFDKLYGNGKERLHGLADSIKNNLDSISISGRYRSKSMIQILEIDPRLFNILNGNMDQVLATGESFDLYLPADKMVLFKHKKYEILERSVKEMIDKAKSQDVNWSAVK